MMNRDYARRAIPTAAAILIAAVFGGAARSAEPPVHWLHGGVLAP